MRRPWLSWCAGGVVALSSCAGVRAQMDPSEDDGAGIRGGGGVTLLGATRVVASWDFEDESDRLFGVPAGWFRSVHNPEGDDPTFRPGFPPFNLATIGALAEGGHALEMPTEGGSASLMLARGQLVAMPGSDYMVTARVRTSGLEHAAARVGIRFVDGAMRPIDGAGEMSEPVRSEGGWTTVRVLLEGDREAAFIQLELQVVQPEIMEPGVGRAHEVVHEDFAGGAWFDDVVVYQVPRIDFHARGERNVVVAPETPELSLRVQDFTGETLIADASVYDVSGALVDERRMIEGGATGAGSSSTVRWSPVLPAYGWYRAVVRLRNGSGIVGQRACDLVWLGAGPEGDAEDRGMFGVALGEAAELGDPDEVAALLADLKSGSVWLGVWEGDRGARTDASDAEERASRLRGLVETLINRRDRLHLVLSAAPRDLADAARTETDDVLGVIAHDPDAAMSALSGLLRRYAERATSWHLGAVGGSVGGGDGGVSERRDAGALVARVLGAMGRVAPRPVVSVGWRAQGEPRALGADVSSPTVRVSDWATPDAVREIVEGWGRVGVTPTLVFDATDEDRFGTDETVRRLVRLGVSAWEAGVGWASNEGALVVERPWRRAIDGRGGAMPAPWFGAWRTMSEELAGRSPVAELYVGEGARAIVADGGTGGSGVIVAWNEWGRAEDAVLRALLGYGPVTVRDHFGNETRVDPVGGEHAIPLTGTPVFISGIDTRLVRFRAGLRLVPGFMESRAQRHALEVEIFNPYRETVQAAVRFEGPESWEFAPRVLRATVAPGARVRVPVEVALGVGETSGVRRLTTEVALTTGSGEQPIQRVPMLVELGMEDLRVTPSYRYLTDGSGAVSGVVVSLLIANTGEREVPLNAFAFAPGQAAREVLIPSLAPGQAIVRTFSFDGAPGLVGQRVRAGVREINGNGRLNYWVELR